VNQLNEHGINVIEKMPLVVGVDEGNVDYLVTKVDKMGHEIEDSRLKRE